jgi:hypothetical protein
VQWGAELGLGPLQAINSIAIINGKPAVYGDAMLALVRGSGLCEDIIEMIKGEGDLATAVCDARRKGSEPVVRAFSVHDAKRAGLWDKAGPWKQYPLRMLQMSARVRVKRRIPDVLRGVLSAEEAADIPREPRDITPLAGELDAFAAAPDDPAQTSAAVQAATPAAEVSPTEAEIERSQEMIAAVLGPEEVAALDAEAEHGELLHMARAMALRGPRAFRQWYRDELDDEARIQLRPHVNALQEAARLGRT